MNTSSNTHRARARRAGIAALAGAAAAFATAAAAAQVTNQPGESDLYRRSGEGAGMIRTSAAVRETGATYTKESKKQKTIHENAAATQRQEPASYHRAGYQQAAYALPAQPAMPPDQSMYVRGERTLGGWDDGRLQGSAWSGQAAPAYGAGEPRLMYTSQPEPWAMNLPPASPEYISDFNRPGNDVMEIRGAATRTQPATTTVSQRTTTETHETAARITPASGAWRGHGGLTYGDVNYYSEIGYGDFTYYSDYEGAPHYPEPGKSGRRTTTVSSKSGAQVTPVSTTTEQYRTETGTTYYTNDPNIDTWLDNADR